MVKPRGERRRIVGAYVRDRLRKECAVRGEATKIARAIGFSTAHVTNVQKEERGVGDDFAEAIARYWGLGYAELEEAAQRWAAENPTEPAPPSAPEEPVDPYPNRARAAQLAREDRVDEAAIRSVLEEAVPPELADWSALRWAIRMKMREHDQLRQIASQAEHEPSQSGETADNEVRKRVRNRH